MRMKQIEMGSKKSARALASRTTRRSQEPPSRTRMCMRAGALLTDDVPILEMETVEFVHRLLGVGNFLVDLSFEHGTCRSADASSHVGCNRSNQ